MPAEYNHPVNVVMFSDAYWPRVNGVTVSVDTFSSALVKAGHKVLIVCSDYPQKRMTGEIVAGSAARREHEPELLRVPSAPVFFSKEDRAAKLSAWPLVEERVTRFDPHVIHINTEFIIAEFGFRYGKKHRVPLVYTFHTIWEDYAAHYFPFIPDGILRFAIRKFQKGLLKKSDLIIVPTPQIAGMLQIYNVQKETRQLPTGVDPALFRHGGEESAAFRKALEEKHPRLRGKRILMFAGRVAKEKNIGFIISLMKDLLEKHPSLALLVVGGGPDLDYYQEEAAAYGVQEHCVFTGYLERGELSFCYAVSDIFVFPSLTETQGLVTIEAMLSGVPVVAIGVLGTVQVMGGDNGGFMVQNDSEEFKTRVFQLLEDRELYRQKSAEALRHAQQWTLEGITGKLAAIYREAPEIMKAVR